MTTTPKTSGQDTAGSSRGTAPGVSARRRKTIIAPDLGSIRSLTARIIVAELWLGIGLVALLSNTTERDFALVVALSTLLALLPSLVWVCDPVRVVARYVLSIGFVAQCVLLAVISLEASGAFTFGIFAFSLVLLAQLAGFVCWRSLLVAGGLLIASTIAVDFWMANAAVPSPVFSNGQLTNEVLGGLLPLWLLTLGVLLPMTYRVERALGEAHSSRLAALEAMTFAVEEARAVAIGKRPNARSAAAALNLRKAVIKADIASAKEQVTGAKAPAMPQDHEIERQLAFGRGNKPRRQQEGEDPIRSENSVHRQQKSLAQALENGDRL